jgi:hypothetical protein
MVSAVSRRRGFNNAKNTVPSSMGIDSMPMGHTDSRGEFIRDIYNTHLKWLIRHINLKTRIGEYYLG